MGDFHVTTLAYVDGARKRDAGGDTATRSPMSSKQDHGKEDPAHKDRDSSLYY